MPDKRLEPSDAPANRQSEIADEHAPAPEHSDHPATAPKPPAEPPKEYGGRKGPDPVRYGDWEKNGRCIDF